MTKKNKSSILLFLFTCIFYLTQAHAISFGKLHTYSYLNEKLLAEIEIDNIDSVYNSDQITINLASSKDFMNAGLPRPFFLTKLKFELVNNIKNAIIVITSDKIINEPFIDLLLELNWGQGRLLKNYTILLDPPPKTSDARKIPKSKQLELEHAAAIKAKASNKNNELNTQSTQNPIMMPSAQVVKKVSQARTKKSTNNADVDLFVEKSPLDDNKASSFSLFSNISNVIKAIYENKKPTSKELPLAEENIAQREIISTLDIKPIVRLLYLVVTLLTAGIALLIYLLLQKNSTAKTSNNAAIATAAPVNLSNTFMAHVKGRQLLNAFAATSKKIANLHIQKPTASTAAATTVLAAAKAAPPIDANINIDIPIATAAPSILPLSSDGKELKLKLDLAECYIDSGDLASAKPILDEVLKCTNAEEYHTKAKILLATLSQHNND